MKKFYTDGVTTIKVEVGSDIPEGFYLGRTFKSNPWNRGLTKETSEKVRLNTEACHKTRHEKENYISWNTGLTKDTSEALLTVSKKVSQYRRGVTSWNKGIPCSDASKEKISAANKGKVPWNLGASKETDERMQNIAKKLVGHTCFVTDWEAAKKKERETRQKNNTTNTSQPEKDFYVNLCNLFGENNVRTQYYSEPYPFKCDFYITSLKLYIELNLHWTHGPHPFCDDNEADVKLLNLWKEKSINSSYYTQAINVWTKSDIKKLNYFKSNNLNYIIIYPNNITIIS